MTKMVFNIIFCISLILHLSNQFDYKKKLITQERQDAALRHICVANADLRHTNAALRHTCVANAALRHTCVANAALRHTCVTNAALHHTCVNNPSNLISQILVAN
jgi:hypothetical protein